MCGVFGIYCDPESKYRKDIGEHLAVAFGGLKHRGPHGAGLRFVDGPLRDPLYWQAKIDKEFLARVAARKVVSGKVSQTLAFGHTLYSTVNGSDQENQLQPLQLPTVPPSYLAFNGNMPHHLRYRQELFREGSHFYTGSDGETLQRYLDARIDDGKRLHQNLVGQVKHGVDQVLTHMTGGYSVVAYTHGALLVFKDQFGIRPLAHGVREREGKVDHIFSSEDHFFKQLDFEYDGEVQPGELFILNDGTLQKREVLSHKNPHPDIFEFIYLAREDSVIFGKSVYEVRRNIGRAISEQIQSQNPDILRGKKVLVSVPNGANSIVEGLAEEIGIEWNGDINPIQKKPDAPRSFLASTQEEREQMVREKFDFLPEKIKGEDIMLVDDSIVRGTTMKILVKILREIGARTVTVVSACPPILFGDHYGIAMKTDQLIARDETGRIREHQEIAELIGADKVIFLEQERLLKAVGLDHMHMAYFDGKYVTQDIPIAA